MGTSARPIESAERRSRVLLESGTRGEPLFVAMAGMHGNEPAGVAALERIARHAGIRGGGLKGRVLFLLGHLAALELGQRFIGTDLNRCFDPDSIRASRAFGPEDVVDDANARVERTNAAAAAPDSTARDWSAERAELHEILEVLEPEVAAAPAPCVLIDMHTASAPGPPFALHGDTLQNRRLGRALPCPKILGLEERVDGTLLGWFGLRGHIALGVEGGQHEDPESVDHLEAIGWLALVAAGALGAGFEAELERSRQRVERAAHGIPSFVAVTVRHHVHDGSGFRMRPGFGNFDAIAGGTPLADEDSGVVPAPFAGRLLLPLYQGRGEDGFFLGRDLSRTRLRLSRYVRRLRLDGVLRLLPGVRRSKTTPRAYEVPLERETALVADLLHLFGYRHRRVLERPDGTQWVEAGRRPEADEV